MKRSEINLPRVSVVMPVHNGERFLVAAVESVLAQTMPELELICVEDGSSDGSAMILDGFAVRDPRVRVLHTGGRGCSAARNAGMDAASGEYIAFIDQDDLYHPRMLELMSDAAEEHDADIVEAAYAKVPESADVESAFLDCQKGVGGRVVSCIKKPDDPFGYFIEQHRLRGGGIVCPVWNRIFRREFVAGVRFPEGVQPGEDSYFSYLAFDNAQSMVVVGQTLYAFRQNGNSTSHKSLSAVVERFITGREAVLRFWTESSSSRREALLVCATREMAWIVKESSKRGDTVTREKVRTMLLGLRKDGVFQLRRLPISKCIKTWLFLVFPLVGR